MKMSKSTNMKNSFSLFEIILTVLISSFIIVYSMLYLKESIFENENSRSIEIHKLELLNTKAFLQKQKEIINKISYSNKTLFFEDAILLKGVESFSIEKKSTYIHININLNNKISQIWKLALK